MASKPSLDDRLSRIEAIASRETDAAEDGFSLRVLRAWSTPDLRRLKSILERGEAGGPSEAITVSEQEWIDATMERAAQAADGK